MTLGFSTKFPNGNPTLFPQKIMASLHYSCNIGNEINKYLSGTPFGDKDLYINQILMEEHSQKIHTIRRDSKDRWREGMDIHFVINNRTKDRFQFAPIIKVKKIQKINIVHGWGNCVVTVDNRILTIEEVKKLALNDGFDTINHFFGWFREDFKGKIIHWTDFSY